MAQKTNAKIDLKIVLVGAAAVGKTSLIHRYINDDFGNTTATIGASFALKAWKDFKFGIWDTAGQEKYASLSSFYCRNAGAALVCYDITEQETFDELDKYVDFLKEGANSDCFIVLVGTKLDLEEDSVKPRKVPKHVAQQYADKIGALFYETSAKTGYNVNEVFDRIGYHVFGGKPGVKDTKKPNSGNTGPNNSNSQSNNSNHSNNTTSNSHNSNTVKLEEKSPEQNKTCC